MRTTPYSTLGTLWAEAARGRRTTALPVVVVLTSLLAISQAHPSTPSFLSFPPRGGTTTSQQESPPRTNTRIIRPRRTIHPSNNTDRPPYRPSARHHLHPISLPQPPCRPIMRLRRQRPTPTTRFRLRSRHTPLLRNSSSGSKLNGKLTRRRHFLPSQFSRRPTPSARSEMPHTPPSRPSAIHQPPLLIESAARRGAR